MMTIGFALPSRFQIMGLAAASAFELANVVAGEKAYSLRLLSEKGGALPNSFGSTIDTRVLGRQPLDTLIVSGLLRPVPSSPEFLRQVRKAAASARRVASMCTGAFI